MIKNIEYTTPAIEQFYSKNRIRWKDFYASERHIIEQINPSPVSRVLDVGCGCGGLGLSLKKRFLITDYTGIDISSEAIATARRLNPDGNFIAGDILSIQSGKLKSADFDMVISLGCVDWNIEFDKMLRQAWDYVKPGGVFISSFRLTDGEGVKPENLLDYSYQYINFEGNKEGEKAPYVVMNATDLMQKLMVFNPAKITAYGYWGKPSSTAVTPYEKVCFTVVALHKGQVKSSENYLVLPEEIRRLIIGTLR